MRTARIIIFFLIGVLVAQCVYYYPNLPEKMASHFNAAGEPNGWMSKNVFFIFEAGLLLLILAEFTLIPFLIRRSPAKMINLPNKDYWLAPERRDEAFAVIGNYFDWFSVLLAALFIAVNQLVFQANLARENISPLAIWVVLCGFLAFVIFWLVKFVRRFKIREYES
ncbi:MAG: DUF1648 domain-containing protein [Pyrinomonadaceae bacterium]